MLSTLLLRYPRWIHAEGRTHRLLEIFEGFSIEAYTPALMDCDDLSRNAASSRAIPVLKMIADIRADPARPLYWGKNIAGMQAKEELTGEFLAEAKALWDEAMDSALGYAERLSYLGVLDGKEIGAHKQIVNRLLEPFSHITVLVSATEWTNFLALRDHDDAEPHIALLAREIRQCLAREDDIQTLKPGEWHTPFVTDLERRNLFPQDWIKLSTARNASTSYKTVDGFDMTIDRAIALHDKLVASTPLHASPCEHVAQADGWGSDSDPKAYEAWGGKPELWHHRGEHGNFVGFRQYRKQLPGECL